MRSVATTEVQHYYFFYYSGGQVHPVAVEIGYLPPPRAFAIELLKLQPIRSLVLCICIRYLLHYVVSIDAFQPTVYPTLIVAR